MILMYMYAETLIPVIKNFFIPDEVLKNFRLKKINQLPNFLSTILFVLIIPYFSIFSLLIYQFSLKSHYCKHSFYLSISITLIHLLLLFFSINFSYQKLGIKSRSKLAYVFSIIWYNLINLVTFILFTDFYRYIFHIQHDPEYIALILFHLCMQLFNIICFSFLDGKNDRKAIAKCFIFNFILFSYVIFGFSHEQFLIKPILAMSDREWKIPTQFSLDSYALQRINKKFWYKKDNLYLIKPVCVIFRDDKAIYAKVVETKETIKIPSAYVWEQILYKNTHFKSAVCEKILLESLTKKE